MTLVVENNKKYKQTMIEFKKLQDFGIIPSPI